MNTREQGLIVFLSDFGIRDPYVGIVHGVIETISKGRVKVFDLTHEIPAFSITAGSYVLYTSYRWFPRDTVFLVVVDPTVGSERKAIAVRTRNYWFVGPDNGVLWETIREDGVVEVRLIENSDLFLKPVSRSFHGRDVFAPVATYIALNQSTETVGRAIGAEELVKHTIIDGCRADSSERYRARVVYVDRFGNVALSFRSSCWQQICGREGRRVRLLGENGRPLGNAVCMPVFSAARPGELVLYANSLGFLELAVNLGSAASVLGLEIGSWVTLEA